MTRAYGIDDPENEIAWPAVFVIDRSGVVRLSALADSVRVRPSPQTLLDALDHAR